MVLKDQYATFGDNERSDQRGACAIALVVPLDLAQEASVGVNTIRRAEVAEDGTSLTVANELAIEPCL